MIKNALTHLEGIFTKAKSKILIEIIVFLYVGENDKTVHLTVKKKGYKLLCNNKKKLNKHRIAKSITDVFIIAPEPRNKTRCVQCEKKVKILIHEMNQDLKL